MNTAFVAHMPGDGQHKKRTPCATLLSCPQQALWAWHRNDFLSGAVMSTSPFPRKRQYLLESYEQER